MILSIDNIFKVFFFKLQLSIEFSGELGVVRGKKVLIVPV